MPLLVDVVNVLHVTGVLPPELAGPDELGLAELIARSRWGGEWVRLICDGGVPGERRPYPSLDIVLRHTGARSADDVIIEEAQRSSFARRIFVVSNDRAVTTAAQRIGCRTLSGEVFLARLATDASKKHGARGARRSGRTSHPHASRPVDGLAPDAVDAWLREFGFPDSPPATGARS